MSDNLPTPVDSKILIYQSDSGETRLEVRLQDETVWLTQNLMAELYGTTKQNISLHIQNIFEEGELAPEATVKKYLTVRQEGSRTVRRLLDYYNLDMIISVGYRVKSGIATRFRQWATARLREYIVKGFTLDDDRLKGGKGLVDYFDELLARIREIRASEARVYQRIREIFALARDYREGEKETQVFFATMQNIPGHWKVMALKRVARVGNGSTPSRENPEYWGDEGYPWLNSSVVNLDEVIEPVEFVTATALRECHLPKIQHVERETGCGVGE